MDLRDDKKVEKIEDKYFMYLALSKQRQLTNNENKKFLKIMSKRLWYLEFEFEVAKTVLSSNKACIVVNNGLTLVKGLKEGLEITKGNPIQENIEQWAAHFSEVLKYESDAANYFTTADDDDYLATFESFSDAKDLSEGYVEKVKDKTYTLSNKK